MEDPSGWLNPVLLLPANKYLEQDMQGIFEDCSVLATANILMGGKYAVIRDQ